MSVVSVKLSPTHFLRGHEAKLEVTASIGDSVIAVVQYHSAKSKTYKLKVGDSGSLTASWKVSANAPLGKGQIKVTVQDPDEPYSTSISFEVTK
ncbi:MAG TPA: hypothetical protein VF221_18810 [Chloroflexota bacterium]